VAKLVEMSGEVGGDEWLSWWNGWLSWWRAVAELEEMGG
jgi:hypothetical protein